MQRRTAWLLFFFSSRRRHTRCSRDWSSDVCSSDLVVVNPDFSSTKYTFVKELGRGGMGTVYLAEDRELNRLVAIKVLNTRSEERRVGKECRYGRWGCRKKEKNDVAGRSTLAYPRMR